MFPLSSLIVLLRLPSEQTSDSGKLVLAVGKQATPLAKGPSTEEGVSLGSGEHSVSKSPGANGAPSNAWRAEESSPCDTTFLPWQPCVDHHPERAFGSCVL